MRRPGRPLICATLPVVSRNGPPPVEGTGAGQPNRSRRWRLMTIYDRNLPADPQKWQWAWVVITVASIALAVILFVV